MIKTKSSAIIISVLIIGLAAVQLKAEWIRKDRGEAAVKNLVIAGNNLVCGNAAQVSLSTDGGDTWESFSSELPEDGHLRDYMVTDGKCLINMFYGFTYDAVYRSDDAGRSWKQILKKETNTLGRVFGLKGRLIIKGENSDGYYISTNSGKTWSYTKGCLIDGKIGKADFNSMVEIADTIFISRNNGPLIASSDGLKTFRTVRGPEGQELSLVQAGPFLLAGQNDYSSGRLQFIVHVSDDRGKSWKRAVTNFENTGTMNRIYSALELRGILYITLLGKVYRSRDRGINWQDISENLLPFAIEADARLFQAGKDIGMMGSVFMWTRTPD